MKGKLLNKSFLKQTALAIPAAALVLGASQAQTTVGINFQGGDTFYGGAYSGALVTDTAFGVPVTDWFTDASAMANGSMSAGVSSSLTVNWTSANTWVSVCEGDPNNDWHNPLPGNPEVLWGYLDDGSPGNSVTVSGLASTFPHGYVIQTIAAEDSNPMTFANSIVSDGVTTNSLTYSYYWHLYDWNGPVNGGNVVTAGLSTQSGTFTSDSITVSGGTPGGGARAPLCGFIITDKPVASAPAPSPAQPLPAGGTISLSAGVVGLLPMTYQWRTNGVPIPGATAATYTKAGATSSDSAYYDVVVNNAYGSVTNEAALVTVDLPAAITWNTPVTSAGDTDVSTTGSAVFAYDMHVSAQTVNGVTFTAAGDGVTGGNFGGHYDGFVAGTAAPATSLSPDYLNVLTGGDYNGGAPATITINNLIPGHQYLVQLWVDDSRNLSQTRTETVTSGGNTVTLSFPGNLAGALGQYTIGTFTANYSHQVINLVSYSTSTAGPSTQINALQLRDLGAPTVTATPVFGPAPGSYLGTPSVAISSGPGSTVYYTMDGTTPTTSSPHGASPVVVLLPAAATTTFKAYGTHAGQSDSAIASATYTTYATPAVPTWINTAGGSWSVAANWSNNIVAGGADVTADFSQLALTANATVTLDNSPTVGNLVFGDVGNQHTWTLNSGSLTLAATTPPTITVNNQATTINPAVASSNGLTKAGPGTLTLGGDNPYTGTTMIDGGVLVLNTPSFNTYRGGDILINNGSTLRVTQTGGSVRYDFQGKAFVFDSVGGGTIDTGTGVNFVFATANNLTNQFVTHGGARDSIIGKSGINLGANAGDTTIFNIARGTDASIDMSVLCGMGNLCPGGIIKTGNGILELAGANSYSYSGPTAVNAGSLLLDGTLGANSAVTVAGGTLGGTGVINGTVDVSGTLAPGTNNLGTLTINNNLTLMGNATFRIDRAGAPTSDMVQGMPSVVYGGTLTVTNTGAALAVGDSFTLFTVASGGTYSGAFTATNLPALAGGLHWDMGNLPVNGSITVAGTTVLTPTFSPPGGGYTEPQVVTITSQSGSTIYYTTDGSDPRTSGTAQSGPSPITGIPVGSTMTLKAYATLSGAQDSAVATANYVFVTSATWLNATGGSWPVPANWLDGAVGSGTGVPANFSTLTLASNLTVTLDGARTIGDLTFGDRGNSKTWTLNPGSGGALTLAVNSGTSTIDVSNQTATLNVVLDGAQGLTKTGNGSLLLSLNETYTGDTIVNAGTLALTANNGAFNTAQLQGMITVNSGATLALSNNPVGWGGGINTIAVNGGLITGNGGLGAFAVTYNLNGATINSGARLDLGSYGGVDGTINSLSNSITSVITVAQGMMLRHDSGQTTYTITVDPGTTPSGIDLQINSPIVENGGACLLTKAGNGTLVLGGVNTYSGGTEVAAGTLSLTGRSTGGGPVTVDDGATLNVTAGGANPAIVATSDLTLGFGGANTLGFTKLSSTTVAPISVTNVVVNSTVTINVTGGLVVGQLPLIKYSGTKSGAGSFLLGTLPAGVSATLVDNTANQSLDLNVTAAPVSIVTDLSGTTNQIYAGTTYSISVVAGGSAPLTYLWKKNGTTPVGSDSPTLTLSSATTNDTGSYSVTVTNALGSAQSATTYLVVLPLEGYPSLVLATSPTAYWPLIETAGPTALDYAGSHNGTYSATVALGVPGPVAGQTAASFTGGSSMSVPYSAALNPPVPFTVEFWIKPNALAFTCPISSTDFDVIPRLGWLFYTDINPGGNGYIANGYYFRVYSSAGTLAVASAAGVLTTDWTYVAGVVDGTNIKIYVNGQLSGSAAWSGTVTPVTSKPLVLGERYDAGFPLSGSMGNVAVYNRALTAQEIQSHAQNAPILQIGTSAGKPVLTWVPSSGGTLQAAPVVTGPYTNVPAATSPWTNTPAAGSEFWRVKF